MAALDTGGLGSVLGAVGYAYDIGYDYIHGVTHLLNLLDPGHPMPLTGPGSPLDPNKATVPLTILPSMPGEPGNPIPKFATPGFAPTGGTPVSVTPTPVTPPPSVTGGAGALDNVPAPAPSDTGTTTSSTRSKTVSDLSSIVNNLISGATQVLTAQQTHTSPTPTIPVGYNLSGMTQGVIPTVGTTGATGGTVSTSHPSTPGVQYVGLFNSLGQLTGFKTVKRRKRRRSLVTKTDIAGLFELKAVFGGMRGGRDMMEAWIASRPK